MYRGYTVSLFAIPVFNTLYFPFYEKIKHQLRTSYGFEKHDVKLYSISAGIAGTSCSVITNPLWLMRTRMQVEIFKNPSDAHFKQKYSHGIWSMFKNINEIRHQEGGFALWKGLPPTLIGIIHPLVFFPMYERSKLFFTENYEKNNNDKLSTKYIMVSAIFSKTVASLVSYPHEVLRARIQYKVDEKN